jgi:hypothetical protein
VLFKTIAKRVNTRGAAADERNRLSDSLDSSTRSVHETDISQDPSDVEMDMWSGPKRRRSLQFRDVSPSKKQKPKKQEQGSITPVNSYDLLNTLIDSALSNLNEGETGLDVPPVADQITVDPNDK